MSEVSLYTVYFKGWCEDGLYRDTSLTKKRPPLGPYSRTMHRALWWS